jgi:Tol biopolymer transport system component
MSFRRGVRLGHYEIDALRGAGGMGEVYRSRDVRLDRTVAVKVLPAQVAADPEFRRRFEREARAVAALSHPHICALYDVGEAPNPDDPAGVPVQFLVMEYLDGESLDDVLQRKPLPLDQALRVSIQIADALDKAHRQGIVHRDLKPGNIMMTAAGAKLLDFGLATVRPAVSGMNTTMSVGAPLTERGTILGTPRYMSPEQIEGKDVDQRTDLFSFGAIVYEMLTGRKAFDGSSAASVMAAILERDPPQPLPSPQLDHIVTRCLAKNRDERWQTAADVMRELAWVAQSGDRVNTPAPASPRSRLVERLAWLATLVTVTAIAVFAMFRATRPAAPLPEQRLEITTPPTFDPMSFAVSPDGTKVVFVANKDGRRALWLRPMNGSAPSQPLAGTDNPQFPFWSPDSRAIGFGASGRLKRIDLEGGAVRPIAQAPLFLGGTWAADGTILFVPNTNSRIFRVSDNGGTPAPVTVFEPQTHHHFPHVLPDGRHFLYYVSGDAKVRGVYIAQMDGASSRRLLDADAAAAYTPGYLLFVRQGTLEAQAFDFGQQTVVGSPITVAANVTMDRFAGATLAALSASDAGPIVYRTGTVPPSLAFRVSWISRAGKPLQDISKEPNILLNPSLSSDDRQLAYFNEGNIWLLDLKTANSRKFTFDRSLHFAGVWSPDNRQIAFCSNRKGAFDLFRKNADGSGGDELLLETTDDKFPTDWSRDGRFLLYRSIGDTTGFDIRAFAIGDRTSFPVLATEHEERDAQFSPDGKWIAYQSNESGRYEIWIRPFPAPGVSVKPDVFWAVSTTGGTQVRWARNGKEVFYVGLDGYLMSAPVHVESDGRAVTVGPAARLFMIGAPRFGGGTALPTYVPSRDGQQFLVTTTAPQESAIPLTVLLNWKPQ